MTNITIQNLRKTYGIASGMEVAVDDISFEVRDGEFVTLVGPSGCGKTTTLRCIAGLETPSDGSIIFGSVDVTEVPASERGLAMMFQNIALYPHMNIMANIAYPLKIAGVAKEERRKQAREAAEIMQIAELLDKHPGELSGGQQQRAALARTIVQDPKAFLMDEPLSDLDAKLKVDIHKEIQRVHQRLGKPTLYVTHDQEEALTMSDRIAVMNDGNLEQIGSREEVYLYPANRFVAQFIGNPSINLVDGTIEAVNDDSLEITAEGATFSMTFDDRLEAPQPGDVTVGFRPQCLQLDHDHSGDHHFEGDRSLLEPVDDRALATIEWKGIELRALVSTNQDLIEGESVAMTVQRSNLYLFDKDSGELIARSADGQAPEQVEEV